jgi:hypothetical protein
MCVKEKIRFGFSLECSVECFLLVSRPPSLFGTNFPSLHILPPLTMMMRSILLALLPALALSFCPQPTSHATLSLGMAPKYDKNTNKWTPTSADEGPEAGYDLWGSLLRQGPNPFIQRVFNADDYEQAVLKFMAGDKVDRNVAQSEMDAYLQNPNDWACELITM